MYLKVIIALFLFTCGSLSATAQGDSLVFRLMDSKNPTPYVEGVMSYFDKFGDLVDLFLVNTPGKKENEVKIATISPTIMAFSANWKFIPVFVRPAQIIHLQPVADSVHFKELPSCEVDILSEMNKKGAVLIGDSWGMEWNKSKNYDLVAQNFEGRYNAQIEKLNTLSASCEVSQEFKNFIGRELRYRYIYDLLAPYFDGKVNLDSASQRYVAKINRMRPEMISCIDSKMLLRFDKRAVYHFNQFLCRKYINTPLEFEAQWDTAKAVFKGQTKEFLLFKLLQTYYGQQLEGFNQYLTEFKHINTDQQYTRYVDSLDRVNNYPFTQEELNTNLEDRAGKKITWKDFLSQNQGKVLYTDFWASWCGPCREEMKNYPALLKQVFESDNTNTPNHQQLSFIFISIDFQKEKWKAALDKLKLDHPIYKHYLLAHDSPLADFFKLNSVPHYAVIGKSGKVKTYNAPRPGDLKTHVLLRKLLSSE